jgi:hypothetical protein
MHGVYMLGPKVLVFLYRLHTWLAKETVSELKLHRIWSIYLLRSQLIRPTRPRLNKSIHMVTHAVITSKRPSSMPLPNTDHKELPQVTHNSRQPNDDVMCSISSTTNLPVSSNTRDSLTVVSVSCTVTESAIPNSVGICLFLQSCSSIVHNTAC